jgi:tetratricopeptide (TPR) repeat protein
MKQARAALFALVAGCVSTSGTKSEALLPKADELFLAGRWSQAAGHYETWLGANAADPRAAEVRVRVGKCRLAEGRVQDAATALDRALATALPPPLRLEALFRRGVVHRVLGDPVRALQDFRALDAAEPDLLDQAGLTVDEVHYERALARFRSGDWPGGQADLARVGPRGPFGAAARARSGLTAYAVQLGAFETEPLARSMSLRVPGASVRTVPGDPPLHLVTVGRFPRFEEAQRELERLRASGHPDALVVP